MPEEEGNQLLGKLAKALLGSDDLSAMDSLGQKAMAAAMKAFFSAALPALAKEIGTVLPAIRGQIMGAPDSDEKNLLLRYLDRALPEIAQLSNTLPEILNELMESIKALESAQPKTFQASEAEKRVENAQKALQGIVLAAFTGVPIRGNEDDQESAGEEFVEEMPLLMKVIMGSLAAPDQEVIPGLKLDLQKPLAELAVKVVGKLVTDIAGELKDVPLANIIHTRIEAFLKDQDRVGKYAAGLITHYLGAKIPKPDSE